jgi:hypothetical protein
VATSRTIRISIRSRDGRQRGERVEAAERLDGRDEAEDLSLTTDTKGEAVDLPRQSPPSRSAADASSPPSTPTVSLSSGTPFPRPVSPLNEEQMEEDRLGSIDVPLSRESSARHRSRSSGDQTVLGVRPVVAGSAKVPDVHEGCVKRLEVVLVSELWHCMFTVQVVIGGAMTWMSFE